MVSHHVFWTAVGLKEFLEMSQFKLPRHVAADLEGSVARKPQYLSGCPQVMIGVK